MKAYQLTAGGARARLSVLRAAAADWRGARRYTMGNYAGAYMTGIRPGVNQWYSHGGENFRNERDAHDILPRLHRGWFTSTMASDRETAIGIVAGLSHGRFIAGYRWTSNDERVYFPGVFDSEDEAARMADEHARVFADDAREDSERFDAMQMCEFNVEEKTTELQKAIALRHRAKFGGKPRVIDAITELREAREELADATQAYERG